MTQVDFYLISNRVTDGCFKLASRLSNKLQRMEQRALVVTDSIDHSQHLDQVMWTFNDTSFVAHDRFEVGASASSSLPAKICISEAEHVAQAFQAQPFDVLVNLSSSVIDLEHPSQRIAEIVDADDISKAAAREKFKLYRQRGFELKTHDIQL